MLNTASSISLFRSKITLNHKTLSRNPARPRLSVQSMSMRTCRRCKQKFDPNLNHDKACQYHSSVYTGGEISKVLSASNNTSNIFIVRLMQAIGFCRSSSAPEHQLRAVVGKTGLIRFWDCCGADEEDAPGCCYSKHVTYDDPE